jgi:hypothetical protein
MNDSEGASTASAQTELEERLRVLDERLQTEMRARGFDPAQDDNLALTGPLARLYMEREKLRDELQTLAETEKSSDE